jgi:hypothetical protein
MWVSDQYHLKSVLPSVMSKYRLTGGWVGFRAWLDVYRKSRCHWVLEPHMAQPIVIHYTDYAILAP